jgi:DNA-binding CsgD family transcriptional regulator
MLAKEISSELAISPHTVKAHLKAAKRRLNARTLAHAVVKFSDENLSD